MTAKASAICGHWHRPSECIENALDGSQLHTWTAGCLCELHPDYLPVNNWAHGCAIISVDDGQARVQLHRIQDGVVV